MASGTINKTTPSSISVTLTHDVAVGGSVGSTWTKICHTQALDEGWYHVSGAVYAVPNSGTVFSGLTVGATHGTGIDSSVAAASGAMIPASLMIYVPQGESIYMWGYSGVYNSRTILLTKIS